MTVNKRAYLLLVVVLSILAAASIVSADSPSGVRITGGGWFDSFVLPPKKFYGGRCEVSLTAQEIDGVWSGHGQFMDKEDYNGVRHKAVLTVNEGVFEDYEPNSLFPPGSEWYHLIGTAEHYEDNVHTGTVGFRLRVVDVGPTPDGIVDTLGFRFFTLGGDWGSLDDAIYRAGSGAGGATVYPSFQGMFRIH
jgi:hypothetical protein